MDSKHIQLAIEKDGECLREHHFFVLELSEIGGYVSNALDRLFQDHPEISPMQTALTLVLSKGELPRSDVVHLNAFR